MNEELERELRMMSREERTLLALTALVHELPAALEAERKQKEIAERIERNVEYRLKMWRKEFLAPILEEGRHQFAVNRGW